MFAVIPQLLRGRRVAEEEGEGATSERRWRLEQIAKGGSSTNLRRGGVAYLRISSRDGAKVAGWGIAGASAMVAGVASGGEEDGGLASG